MLIEFTVSNYRSIGEEQILSLVPATKQREYPDNIIHKGKYAALNALAIYGANASGKSNLLRAMRVFDELIHLSARSSSTDKLPYEPFLLRKDLEKKPTKFEITFIIKQDRYRYGFEFLEDIISSEWLYRKSQSREVSLFLREKDVIETSPGFKGSKRVIDTAIEATRPNALFLSFCDTFNIEEVKTIFQWFGNFNITDGLNTEREEIATVSILDNKDYRKKVGDYLDRFNLGFTGIEISTKEFDTSDLPEELSRTMRNRLTKQLRGKKSYKVLTEHKVYSSKGIETKENISWELNEKESSGTIKAFHLSGPILWALSNGGVLIIDEIEAKMHPILTRDIINTFLNKESNPNKAQLIFATHDTNLLTYSDLRRDQIYFSEKNKWESTEIYSLSDFVYLNETNKNGNSIFEKERPDTDKEKRYFEGRYGAIPIIGNFTLIKSKSNGEKG
jgi:AAA15 family ATPase/GTPase